MFDYNGYSEKKLLDLCDDVKANKGKAPWHYWTSEVYSFGKHLRDYALYPEILPLYVYSNHGITWLYKDSEIPKHELENNAECMLCLNPENTDYYRKNAGKPAHCLYSPFVWYRRKNKIKQIVNAKGTLAFPAHTTPDIDLLSGQEEYIQDLKKLPQEFQPVAVCLHMHDINKGIHELFLKHGFPVYTAGNAFDYRFAERFYDIMKNFKYTTSNSPGSYAFYSVEMGIPFSLYGNKPKIVNKSDPNLQQGEIKFKERNYYKERCDIFKGLNKIISEKQKEYVEKNLGIYDGISRFKMAKVLYQAYFKRGNLLEDLRKGIKLKN